MERKELHPKKIYSPSSVTEGGITILHNDVHPQKAPLPMDVMDGGMTILSSDMQYVKAPYPIDVTDGGITIFVSDSHHSTEAFHQPQHPKISLQTHTYTHTHKTPKPSMRIPEKRFLPLPRTKRSRHKPQLHNFLKSLLHIRLFHTLKKRMDDHTRV